MWPIPHSSRVLARARECIEAHTRQRNGHADIGARYLKTRRRPQHRIAKYRIETLPEQYRAITIGNNHRVFREVQACGSEIRAWTDRQTDMVITTLRYRIRSAVEEQFQRGHAPPKDEGSMVGSKGVRKGHVPQLQICPHTVPKRNCC